MKLDFGYFYLVLRKLTYVEPCIKFYNFNKVKKCYHIKNQVETKKTRKLLMAMNGS